MSDQTVSPPQIPPGVSRRGIVTGVATGVVIALALYTAGWFVAAHLLQKQVDQWIGQQRTAGFSLRIGGEEVMGFPFHLIVRLGDVDVAAPAAKGGWTWQTPNVDVSGSPLRIHRLNVGLSGVHTVSGPWFKAGPKTTALQITLKHADLALRLDGAGQVDAAEVEVDQGDVSWSGAASSVVHANKMVTKVITLPLPNTTTGPMVSSRLAIDIDSLVLPGALPAPLTTTVAKAELTADIVGPLKDASLPQILEAWSAGGGAINIKSFAIDWPPLYLAGDGTVALDKNLQPMGAFTTRMRGFGAAIDVLVEQHRVDKREAGIAKAALGLMSKNTTDGPEINVPLTVQDRMLSLGPLTLFELPQVEWPAGPPP